MNLADLKAAGEAPEWMTEAGLQTLMGGYLLPDETPKGMYTRVAKAAGSYYSDTKWTSKFFDALWANWLCPASPVASNLGTTRGLPVSCNTISPADSLDSIFDKNHELAILSKNGAGVGIYMGDIRGRGVAIKGNGRSEGMVPWAKIYDQTISSVSQGSRRGAAVLYLPVTHTDIGEFLNIRRPVGDPNRRCLNINHAVTITDDWMNSLIAGDQNKRELWKSLLTARVETGEPYLLFTDTVNNANPECYKANGLSVKSSNLCLAGDTLVVTDKGTFQIKELVGKTVTIWDGKNWVVNSNFRQTGINQKLFRIHLSDGSHVDTTEEHRWFTKPPDKRYSEYPGFDEVKTKDLKVDMKLKFHCVESHGDIRVKSAYAKGFLIAEGTRTKISRIRDGFKPLLTIYADKIKCFKRLEKSIYETELSTGLRSDAITEISIVEEVKTKRFVVRGLANRRALVPWCDDFKRGLPPEFLLWDKSSKLDFVAGIFDGDGSYLKSGGGYQIVSIEKQLLSDLQVLLKSTGIKSTIGLMREAGVVDFKDGYGEYPSKQAWRLTISSFWANKLSELVHFERLVPYAHKRPNRYCVDFTRIVKIEALGTANVYCTSVPSTTEFALGIGVQTGNCNEIVLHTDVDHSFVCCLSSLNLTKWDEWKDTDLVKTAVRFLDAVLEEYVLKASKIPHLEASVRSAVKGRAIGIGVLGWHTLLQSKDLPFDHFESMMLNATVFRKMKTDAETETAVLATEKGEPEWCKGFGRRNTHLLAVAPTVSNSTISGGHSAGIEPLAANIYSQKSAKGTFIVKNPKLVSVLQALGKDTPETWKSINEQSGSVQHLSFLSNEQKLVLLTAREINQHAIIKQAGQRQKYIDQSQSVNLFFASNSDPKYIHEVHLAAWKEGLKGLYYCRSEGVLRGDLASRSKDECAACEG